MSARRTDAGSDPDQLLSRIEQFVRRDPARRGLLCGGDDGFLAGEVESAARHLVEHGSRIAVVTGFLVPDANRPVPETDGPPGSALLAAALEAVGLNCCIVTDEPCAAVVGESAAAFDLPAERIIVCPTEWEAWRKWFWQRGPGRELSHLIAVERPGPTHTLESLEAQNRLEAPPVEAFSATLEQQARNRCLNMRGECLDDFHVPLFRLFEEIRYQCPQAKTIGIGDGGNEIGMGAVAWEELAARVASRDAARTVCRVATDWLIVAGTSNWGAMALAAACLLLANRLEVLNSWTVEHQQVLLERLVSAGYAVDGVTRRREATVDGLPFATYIQPWEGIRRLLLS